MTTRPTVAVFRAVPQYPPRPPFHPDERFPEYRFSEALSGEPNPVYAAVRGALEMLGLDSARRGTPEWNPLGEIVRPGDTVLLKPNFIRDFHDTQGDQIEALITHGSIIRAVADYVMLALAGDGKVVVADAPQSETRFSSIVSRSGLEEMREFYQSHGAAPLQIVDLRPQYTEKVEGVIVGHRALPGDPAGYRVVNLGRHSEFTAVNHLNHRLYGSEYDRAEVAAHHHDDVHEYLIAQTALDCNVFINLPKMKTHKKVGVTLNLKSLVGINGNKNWLPHHREGVPADGGDQFSTSGLSQRLERVVVDAFKRQFPKLGPLRRYVGGPMKKLGAAVFGDTGRGRIRSGNWHGNDTTWRMALDLNRAIVYADRTGRLQTDAQRRFFSVVDGIIAGEGNGPTGCDARAAGLIVAGCDPLSVDLTCTRLMGLDYRKVPTLFHALADHAFPLCAVPYEKIVCRSNAPEYNRPVTQFSGPCLGFRPHFGWRGHLELFETSDAASTVA